MNPTRIILTLCLLFLQTGLFAQHYLYVGRAPKDRNGFRTLKSSIEVHDIDKDHQLVKAIPLPNSVLAIRAMFAHAPSKRLFISHYGTMHGGHTGYVLCEG